MNMNLLRIFHEAARCGSFTLAAHELHLTQPGVSKHIRELERCLSAPLFDRVGKRVHLTQAGEILYQTTAEIFATLAGAKAQIRDLQGLTCGTLSIAASITIGTYLLPLQLVRFRELHPGVDLKLDIALSRQAVARVLDHAAELAFVGHSEEDARLVVTPFLIDRMFLAIPPAHPWQQRTKPVALRELADQPFLLSRQGSGTRIVVEDLLRNKGVVLRQTMEMGTTEGVKQGIAAGLGISILSEHVIRTDLTAERIAVVPLRGVDLKRTLYIVRHKDRSLSEAGKAFLKLLKGSFESVGIPGDPQC